MRTKITYKKSLRKRFLVDNFHKKNPDFNRDWFFTFRLHNLVGKRIVRLVFRFRSFWLVVKCRLYRH